MKLEILVDRRCGYESDQTIEDPAFIPTVGSEVMLKTMGVSAHVVRVVCDYSAGDIRVYTKTY